MCLGAARFLPAVPFVSADTVSQMLGPACSFLPLGQHTLDNADPATGADASVVPVL